MLVSLWCTLGLGLGPLGAKELLKVRVRSWVRLNLIFCAG